MKTFSFEFYSTWKHCFRLMYGLVSILSFFLFLLILSPWNHLSAEELNESELKITVYGYPDLNEKKYFLEDFNPLQTENLSLLTPGLTIAKLGSLGQKTSFRYNSFASGDLTLLYDGFEISDPSDPSEGFDLASFVVSPQFDFGISNGNSLGLFSRQIGGVISIDPNMNDQSYIRSAAGSDNQGLLAIQKNHCTQSQCLSLSAGGTYANAQSASRQRQTLSSSNLENDPAGLGYLSLGWQKKLSESKILKIRTHSQFSKVDLDDYDPNFIFSDDPNSNLQSSNHFLGVSYYSGLNQLFFENTYSLREVVNLADTVNSAVRDDTYQVLRTKTRGSHNLSFADFFWYTQNLSLNTESLDSGNNKIFKDISKLEIGVQADKKIRFENLSLLSSVNLNSLESFGTGYGLSQTLERRGPAFFQGETFLIGFYGFKERRPSVFQLFDPQFGNLNLQNEKQLFIRPQVKIILNNQSVVKHNISIEYFYENIDSRVIFLNQGVGNSEYQNSTRLNSNSMVLSYFVQSPRTLARVFIRESFDSVNVLKSLPWLAKREFGLGTEINLKKIKIRGDVKWLMGMFNPSQNLIGTLAQSQASVLYQIDTAHRISLQLNNVFNDKKIWDEGFQRQGLSWMLSLTKTI